MYWRNFCKGKNLSLSFASLALLALGLLIGLAVLGPAPAWSAVAPDQITPQSALIQSPGQLTGTLLLPVQDMQGHSRPAQVQGVTCPPDVDGSGFVDTSDVQLVAGLWHSHAGDGRYRADYDQDADGDVDLADVMLVALWLNHGCSQYATPTPSPTGQPTSTPTPTSIPTFTATPTDTPTPTSTPTATPIPTSAPTSTPTPTPTPCGSLSGVISTDTELQEDCDYLVTGHTLVQAGVTLTIRPGVSLRFDGSYYLKVEGLLNSVGTSEKQIVFTSNDSNPSPGDWIAVALVGSEQSVVSHAVVEYGGQYYHPYDAAIYTENGSHLIDNVVFRNSGSPGALRLNGNHIVQNSTFVDNNSSQLVFLYNGASDILTNTFRSNAGTGTIVVASNYVNSDISLIQGNYFENNTSVGTVFLYTTSSRAVIRNNTFISNTASSSAGWPGIVKLETFESAVVECNLFTDNRATSSDELKPGGVIMVNGNPANATINSNNIYQGHGDYDLVVSYTYDPSNDLDATNNYWGTTSSSEIESRIYDYYDDFNLPKAVFEPYSLAPVPCATSLPSHSQHATRAMGWLLTRDGR